MEVTKEFLLNADTHALLELLDSERPNFGDSFGCFRCVLCTYCKDCKDCTNCTYCTYCTNCKDCTGCTYCTNCTYCRNCTGLTDKKYVIKNVQLSEEEYFRVLAKFE